MVEYKITPADHKIIEGISPTDNWRDLNVSFRNKVLPAGNLDKPIGNKCYKLLKTLIKKDKVSSSTLSKGCPSLNKKNMKDQTKSITKMEIKKDRDMKKKADRDNDAQDKDDLKRLKRKEEFGAKLQENEGATKKLLDTIVKQQNQAKVQLIAGQVDSVRNILQDTTQPTNFPAKPKNLPPYTPSIYTKEQQEEMEKAHDDFIDSKYNKYKEEGGTISRHEFLIEEADREAQQNQVPNAYQHYMEDNYEEFVIPQYSVELDPILNDPRNN
tara:strand:+ start:32 stop:841 length:810 start_codon:yes stop_codon:yes gene_type:complete